MNMRNIAQCLICPHCQEDVENMVLRCVKENLKIICDDEKFYNCTYAKPIHNVFSNLLKNSLTKTEFTSSYNLLEYYKLHHKYPDEFIKEIEAKRRERDENKDIENKVENNLKGLGISKATVNNYNEIAHCLFKAYKMNIFIADWKIKYACNWNCKELYRIRKENEARTRLHSTILTSKVFYEKLYACFDISYVYGIFTDVGSDDGLQHYYEGYDIAKMEIKEILGDRYFVLYYDTHCASNGRGEHSIKVKDIIRQMYATQEVLPVILCNLRCEDEFEPILDFAYSSFFDVFLFSEQELKYESNL